MCVLGGGGSVYIANGGRCIAKGGRCIAKGGRFIAAPIIKSQNITAFDLKPYQTTQTYYFEVLK